MKFMGWNRNPISARLLIESYYNVVVAVMVRPQKGEDWLILRAIAAATEAAEEARHPNGWQFAMNARDRTHLEGPRG